MGKSLSKMGIFGQFAEQMPEIARNNNKWPKLPVSRNSCAISGPGGPARRAEFLDGPREFLSGHFSRALFPGVQKFEQAPSKNS